MNKENSNQKLMTSDELMAMPKTSRPTLYRLLADQQIPFYKTATASDSGKRMLRLIYRKIV